MKFQKYLWIVLFLIFSCNKTNELRNVNQDVVKVGGIEVQASLRAAYTSPMIQDSILVRVLLEMKVCQDSLESQHVSSNSIYTLYNLYRGWNVEQAFHFLNHELGNSFWFTTKDGKKINSTAYVFEDSYGLTDAMHLSIDFLVSKSDFQKISKNSTVLIVDSVLPKRGLATFSWKTQAWEISS